ncbi:MAG: glycine cleavage T C-terminal barrel domain-containing protein, partial [bacterium]
TTNELRNLNPGDGQINIFTYEKGKIIDRCVFLKNENNIQIVTSPENDKKVADWIRKYIFIEDVSVETLSMDTATVSLFGPQSAAVLNKLFSSDFHQLSEFHHKRATYHTSPITIFATSELGVPGFNLLTETGLIAKLWDDLMKCGAEFGLRPMGEESFEVLRIENGWPIFGKDFDDTVNPHEAGLLPYIDFDKGCYIGQEVIARLDTYEKVQKYLMGVVLEGDWLPALTVPVFIENKEAGYLTSSTRSLALDKNVALAYVRTKAIREQANVVVKSKTHKTVGELVKLPFLNLI